MPRADFFRGLVERAAVAVVVVGADGTVRYASPEARRMLCAGKAALRGRLFPSLFTPETAAPLDAFLSSLTMSAPPQTRRVEAQVIGDDDDVRTIGLVAVNLTADPSVGGLVVTLSDHTEDRRRRGRRVGHVCRTGSPGGVRHGRGLTRAQTASRRFVSKTGR